MNPTTKQTAPLNLSFFSFSFMSPSGASASGRYAIHRSTQPKRDSWRSATRKEERLRRGSKRGTLLPTRSVTHNPAAHRKCFSNSDKWMSVSCGGEVASSNMQSSRTPRGSVSLATRATAGKVEDKHRAHQPLSKKLVSARGALVSAANSHKQSKSTPTPTPPRFSRNSSLSNKKNIKRLPTRQGPALSTTGRLHTCLSAQCKRTSRVLGTSTSSSSHAVQQSARAPHNDQSLNDSRRRLRRQTCGRIRGDSRSVWLMLSRAAQDKTIVTSEKTTRIKRETLQPIGRSSILPLHSDTRHHDGASGTTRGQHPQKCRHSPPCAKYPRNIETSSVRAVKKHGVTNICNLATLSECRNNAPQAHRRASKTGYVAHTSGATERGPLGMEARGGPCLAIRRFDLKRDCTSPTLMDTHMRPTRVTLGRKASCTLLRKTA